MNLELFQHLFLHCSSTVECACAHPIARLVSRTEPPSIMEANGNGILDHLTSSPASATAISQPGPDQDLLNQLYRGFQDLQAQRREGERKFEVRALLLSPFSSSNGAALQARFQNGVWSLITWLASRLC